MKTKSMENRFEKKFINMASGDLFFRGKLVEDVKAFIKAELKANDKKWRKRIEYALTTSDISDFKRKPNRIYEISEKALDNLLQEKV